MDMEAIQRRIAQFETMVRPEADPDNDMAWFSLGGAYTQAGRHADAARAFQRCVEINPAFTKAFQMAGQALMDAGDNAAAGEVLTRGFLEASRRGDRMPAKGMADLLARLGMPVPQVTSTAPATDAPAGTFVCKRTGRSGHQLPRPPFKGPLGVWIHENISAETWDEWIRQGTKVINELRLDLSRDDDADKYDRFMREYLGIDDDTLEKLNGASA
ncbi:MAG: Fe(2+)-trafficking protein [Phycisphaerales bacterium]